MKKQNDFYAFPAEELSVHSNETSEIEETFSFAFLCNSNGSRNMPVRSGDIFIVFS